ncbi:MAG: transcription factor S [Candidatus Bathyarchaeia archaeon]
MKFCPKCGIIMTPVKKENSILLKCPKCGFETKEADKALSRVRREKEKVIVIERKAQEIRTLPKARVECPRCGHTEAFYWIVQTRGADESSTQFFRCAKCGYTWREVS